MVAVSRSIGLFQEAAIFVCPVQGRSLLTFNSATSNSSLERVVFLTGHFPLCSCSNLEPKHGPDGGRIACSMPRRHKITLK